MDFLILKVNGQDVSSSSHEDAVKCFQSAEEPIVVEVLRRHNNPVTTSTTTTTTSHEHQEHHQEHYHQEEEQQHQADHYQINNPENTMTLLVSTGVQTDWAGLIDDEDFVPVTLHADEQTNDSFDDILSHEIDFEEVTLQKSGSAEKLGLTVCYSSGSGSEDADTEVYISEIVPESLAARDGRLREGDQILRVNGKDVSNKEQTENLFAETKSAVTILVSRCLYTDEEYDDRRIYHEGSARISPEATTPAYQNSIIEQLIRQQKQQQELEESSAAAKGKDGETSSSGPAPIVPSHLVSPSAKTPGNGELEQQQQQRRKWMQEALKECVRKIDGMSVSQKKEVKLVETYSSHVWSDTEHIYETIPESDSEPIYSSPYEHQNWLHQPNNNHLQSKNQTGSNSQTTSNNAKLWHSSSKSNSSGEEKDSSSAYNTGESCNSNTLTLELQQPSEHHRNTLVLCPPPKPITPAAAATSTPKVHCNCSVPLAPPPTKFTKNSHPQNQQSSRRGSQHQPQAQSQSQPQPQPQPQPQLQPQPGVLAAETMYTNVANLQQTIRLQQQLFKQAMSRRKSGSGRESCYTRRSRCQPGFQAPNLAQYQFVASSPVNPRPMTIQQQVQQQQQHQPQEQRRDPIQMEWKVKRRPDGTRYITRRPVRNRILRNRALRISEERQGHTTEEDAISEIKVGRYWNKEERKKQLEKARERKQRQQELIQQQQQQQQIQQNSEQLICDYIDESSKMSKKQIINIEQGYKKTLRKKTTQVDDFTTVQEILVQGNRSSAQNPAGKIMGLLSVTTV